MYPQIMGSQLNISQLTAKHEETDVCDIFRADKVVKFSDLSFNLQHGIYMTNRDLIFLRRVIVSCKKHDSTGTLYGYLHEHYRYYRPIRHSDNSEIYNHDNQTSDSRQIV